MKQGFIIRSRIIAWQCFICFLLPVVGHAQTTFEDPAPSRIIVKWKAQSSRSHIQSLQAASNDLHKLMGLALRHRRGISEHMEGLQLESPLTRMDFEKALARIRSNPDVEFAVEDKRRFALSLTNDPLITATSGRTGQWYLNDPAANSQWVSAINAITAWNYSTGGASGSGIVVAVVDTGIRADHPDLAGKILPGYDFMDCDQSNCTGSGLTYFSANDGNGRDNDPSDPGDWLSSEDKAAHPSVFTSGCATDDSSWHGTRVAGIIGAATNNGIGIAGIGYNARILPIRTLGKCGGYDSDITAGMRWAAGLHVTGIPDNTNPARVINLSLGSADPCNQTYTTVINELKAISPGVSIVASAGNDSAATNTPANCPGVIGVTAIRNVGSKVGFSSLGPEVSIAAPGGNCGSGGGCAFSIDTTTNLGTLDQTQTCPITGNATAKCRTTPGVNDYTDQLNANLGTSFSAPIVSGTIALMLGANPNLAPDKITTQLKATATAFPQPETTACVSTSDPAASTTNASPCNCSTSLCGAGMVNALKAVQSVAPPSILITGNSTVALNGTDTLDASTSSSANGSALTYAWSILTDASNAATPRTGTASSFAVTAPNMDETLVVHLIVTDALGNSGSKDFSIAVGTGGSSSSSSSSVSSSSSTSSSSSSVASSSSSSLTVTGATKGGGALQWQWLTALAALLLMRAAPYFRVNAKPVEAQKSLRKK